MIHLHIEATSRENIYVWLWLVGDGIFGAGSLAEHRSDRVYMQDILVGMCLCLYRSRYLNQTCG
jgi:hypothetical protein